MKLNSTSRSCSSTSTSLSQMLIHLIMFNILMPSWTLWSGRALTPKFDFRDDPSVASEESIESSLQIIHDIATENIGTLCISKQYSSLKIPLTTARYDGARQKSDLASSILQELGFSRHSGLLDAIARGLLSDPNVINARILATNLSSGFLSTSVYWTKVGNRELGEPQRREEEGLTTGNKPYTDYPWFEDSTSTPSLRSPKFASSPPNLSFKGWWTYPYYSCTQHKWIISYSIAITNPKHPDLRGFLSIDIDISSLYINQCDSHSGSDRLNFHYNKLNAFNQHQSPPFFTHPLVPPQSSSLIQYNPENEIDALHGSHKCHQESMDCQFRPQYQNNNNNRLPTINGWMRGSYQCLCRQGYYSTRHPDGFNGTIMEVAYEEYLTNTSTFYVDSFICLPCMEGCDSCSGPTPCLATYNWPFRITILTSSMICVLSTIILALYVFHHRKLKVFKTSSPTFLMICLTGCGIMYLEMAAIFPYLDFYSCIATKWTRHMGFCITYTALLMKTWRVSLTYRVKSAHKVKLTDKQLLQWMVPILLVMGIYLSIWTVAEPPAAEDIKDIEGLKFKQCTYNWYDHALAIGEVLFLLWGIRVCYNVRNAESLYNEAKLISYAIYNIAVVNIFMAAIHLCIFPQAGPDIKYLLGFIRTQLSTTTTIMLVFGPKILRVLRGQGDKWDNRSRARGITASFFINGGGLMPEGVDLYQENEELKEQIQKLAGQIEFMRIVQMEVNNRHLKPKPGGYFTITSPIGKSLTASRKHHHTSHSAENSKHENSVIEDGHSGTTNSIGGVSSHANQNGSSIEKV